MTHQRDYKPVVPQEDLRNREIGGVTVLYLLGHYQHAVWWQCRCECGKEVRRRGPTLKAVGGSLLCQKCTAKKGPIIDPTPEDIARETAAIRARWSERERARRCGVLSAAVEIQQVSPVPTRTEVTLI